MVLHPYKFAYRCNEAEDIIVFLIYTTLTMRIFLYLNPSNPIKLILNYIMSIQTAITINTLPTYKFLGYFYYKISFSVTPGYFTIDVLHRLLNQWISRRDIRFLITLTKQQQVTYLRWHSSNRNIIKRKALMSL